MKKTIEVVAAVITKGDKFFCAQRADKGELAKKWEFPGGKIEKGETKEKALIRELKEELDIDVSVDSFIMTVNHEYNGFNLILHAFSCSLLSEEIHLKEHLDSKWLSLSDLSVLDWAAADIPVVNKLRGD